MGYFFQGWRRKSGMLSLVLALLLVVGWVRSFSMLDGAVLVPNQETYIEVISKGSRNYHLRLTRQILLACSSTSLCASVDE